MGNGHNHDPVTIFTVFVLFFTLDSSDRSVHDKCTILRRKDNLMAVKTITIDMDAYGILASAKQGSESFSRVIKRRFSKTTTGRTLLSHLNEVCLSPSALKGVETVLKARGKSIAKSPTL